MKKETKKALWVVRTFLFNILALFAALALLVWSTAMVYGTFSALANINVGSLVAIIYCIWMILATLAAYFVATALMEDFRRYSWLSLEPLWKRRVFVLTAVFTIPVILLGSALFDDGREVRRTTQPAESRVALLRAVFIGFDKGQIRFAPLLEHQSSFTYYEGPDPWARNTSEVCRLPITRQARPQDEEMISSFAQPGSIVLISILVPAWRENLLFCRDHDMWSEPLAVRPLPPEVFEAPEA